MSIGYSFDRVLLVVCAVLFSCTTIQALHKACGYKPRILSIANGTTAHLHEFPWQVSLRIPKNNSLAGRHICGGSIISDRWVVTAAHCVDMYADIESSDDIPIQAVVGALKLSKPTIGERSYSIKKIHLHPNWNKQNSENDIALLETNSRMNMKLVTKANAICLGPKTHNVEGQSAVISGWGYTSEYFPMLSDKLKRATVTVESQSTCQNIYSWLGDNEVCAGKTTSTCNGDSGGPLQYEIDGRWYLLGVASRTINCGSETYPAVFTRVPSYLEFIEQTAGITPP